MFASSMPSERQADMWLVREAWRRVLVEFGLRSRFLKCWARTLLNEGTRYCVLVGL